MDEDDGEHRANAGAGVQRTTPSLSRRPGAASARRPSTRRRRHRRDAARGSPRRASRRSSARRRRARCARRARRRRRRTRRGRWSRARFHASAAWGTAPPVRTSGADSGSATAAATRAAISRAWLKPRSRWRAGESGSATTRSGCASGCRAASERSDRGRERRSGPVGKREAAPVLELDQQPVGRKRVDERRDRARPRRRMRETGAADAAVRAGRAQVGHAAVDPGNCGRAGRAEQRGAGVGHAQRAPLRQCQAREARKRSGERPEPPRRARSQMFRLIDLTRGCPPATLGRPSARRTLTLPSPRDAIRRKHDRSAARLFRRPKRRRAGRSPRSRRSSRCRLPISCSARSRFIASITRPMPCSSRRCSRSRPAAVPRTARTARRRSATTPGSPKKPSLDLDSGARGRARREGAGRDALLHGRRVARPEGPRSRAGARRWCAA